ncbi:MAG: transposase [Bacteroidales bacterium]|nr:transposase [Bacteroidales bacterium]
MEKDTIYHLYNRGNNRQKIFFNRNNYLFFLQKVRKHLYPHCDIFAYCLMPNHFHFMIYANANSEKTKKYGNGRVNIFSENLRIMLSSYTQAINKQENRTGSLFQQNSKLKPLNDVFYGKISKPTNIGYDYFCFHYIHNNPVNAGIVNKNENWEFSSYQDYLGLRNGSLINKTLALKTISFEDDLFNKQSGLIKFMEKF